VPLAQGERQAVVNVLDRAGHALVVQVAEGLQFGPRRRHIDGDDRGAVPAAGRRAAMQDEIALRRARPHPGPLAPRA